MKFFNVLIFIFLMNTQVALNASTSYNPLCRISFLQTADLMELNNVLQAINQRASLHQTRIVRLFSPHLGIKAALSEDCGNGNTPLHLAMQTGISFDMIQTLTQYADPWMFSKGNVDGQTPFDVLRERLTHTMNVDDLKTFEFLFIRTQREGLTLNEFHQKDCKNVE